MRERGVEFDVIYYLDTPPSRADLEQILDRIADPPADLVRKDKTFEALGLVESECQTRDAVIETLLAHPEVMQRPVVVRGDRAVIARPSDRVLELLDPA